MLLAVPQRADPEVLERSFRKAAREHPAEVTPASGWLVGAVRDGGETRSGERATFTGTSEGLRLEPGRAGAHRPIFVATTPFGPVACTRLTPLLEVLGSAPALDVDFLAGELTLGPALSSTATPYRGIERIPQGETWVLEGGSRQRRRSVEPLHEPSRRGSGRELASELRAVLERALLRAARGTDRIAVATSGGLDSSCLLAFTHDLWRRDALAHAPLACHLAYEDAGEPRRADHRHFRSLADRLRLDVADVAPREVGPTLYDSFVVDGWPSGGMMSSIYCALGRAARARGVDLLLTGDGGDSVLEGHSRLLGGLARGGDVVGAVLMAFRLRGWATGGPLWRVGNYVLRPLAAGALPPWARRLRPRPSAWDAYPWAGPRLRRHLASVADLPCPPAPSLEWSPAEWYEMLTSLPYLDRLTLMRSHQEILVGHAQVEPYLDDEVLRFVATLPPLSLLHGDIHRGLLREAARGSLPEDVRLRDDKGSLIPALLDMIDAAGGLAALDHLTDVRMLADLGLVEPAIFRRCLGDLTRNPYEARWTPLWAVLSTEAFLRAHAGERREAEAA